MLDPWPWEWAGDRGDEDLGPQERRKIERLGSEPEFDS